ncbi:Uncharacterised protein [Neisseria meningitidis]|nr:putative membrane protein [Neisseria meningitidis NM3042]EOC76012.1 putative membrane protein [Neisseria meningitidis NM51]EOC78995.1 putative membrane protein [Neisseria meningitidis NM80]EOC81867.1 putative membrane protein [Neisseria meningitidis NM165]EOC82001.1 putative membrane protein [Neisseria meningitidis NM3223]CWP45050.1 Uncharacterised protein [Neisseria meningitidis]
MKLEASKQKFKKIIYYKSIFFYSLYLSAFGC